ncbi:S8 family serine peptidase [Streptomyces sp. NPDC058691]|uniref:S8 family serine peptidase n=1 Tax=Streptomyces sp. NPDC058691 TaxID=3346601 RepID=UPI00365C9841
MPPSLRRGRRIPAVGIALALLPALGAVPASASTSASPSHATTATAADLAARAAAQGGGAPRTVTLINGDEVTVTGSGALTVTSLQDAEGRPVAASTTKIDGDTYVYPQEVMPYVSAGVLDKNLFNVTRLLSYGYDNSRTDRIPLIVRYSDAAHARAKAVPEAAAGARALTSIQGAAVTERHDGAKKFWDSLTEGVNTDALARSSTLRATLDGAQGTARKATAQQRAAAPLLAGGIERVWLDGKVKADLADTVGQIGAPEVWKGGNTGQGVDVAVLDTGVDDGHPDLAGRIAAEQSFVPGDSAADRHGHGTHVASTIVGTGAASDGKEKGVAPGARLHVGKVLDDSGSGQTSWILAGMEWAARTEHAKVISMSLGGADPSDGTDPMSMAVDSLSEETGTLFTIAAGNTGRSGSISSPGAANDALTVGAVDSSDALADFSSRGPRAGDAAIKPEITAPGVEVLAARSQYSPGQGSYTTMSGTSMATPHVAGAAVLVAAAHPGWTGRRIKDALVSTAKATPAYTAYQAGNGRVDAAAAAAATLLATGTVSEGVQSWPPAPGATVDREVTYTNTGGTPVTLDLAVKSPRSPAGLFTLSAPKVTVPAGGTAAVTVTTHLDATARGRSYDARVEASTGGTVKAATAVGVSTRNEQFELTVVPKDRSGRTVTDETLVFLQQGQDPGLMGWLTIDGPVTFLIDGGPWTVAATVPVEGVHGPHSRGLALLAAPEITLDHDTTLTLDASKARRLNAVTPKETVTTEMRVDYVRTREASGTWEWSFNSWPDYDSFFALPTGEKVEDGTFDVRARWRDEQPVLKISSDGEDVDDILVRQSAEPLPKGNLRLDTVWAGQGVSADYTELQVRGKAAVVRRDETVSLAEQTAAAAEAGARMLIVVDGLDGRRLDPRTDDSPPITVVAVGEDQGEALIRRAMQGGASLRLHSDPETDYLYDLTKVWSGAVPDDPTYRPQAGELAQVKTEFDNYRQADARDYRYDIWPGFSLVGLGTELPRPARGTRTDWVSTGSGVQWAQAATVIGEVRILAPQRTYAPGSVTHDQWFAPIARPRANWAFPGNGSWRQDDLLILSVPGWGDGGTRREGYAVTPDAQATASLYQGDTLLARSPGTFAIASGLKPERLPYRYVLETARGDWASPYSTGTRTAWDFTSAPGRLYEGVALPLIQLDYAVDTDDQGRADRDARFTVTPSHLTSPEAGQQLPPTSAIGKVGLEVSYDDGATWHTAPLKHIGDGWRARLDAPRQASYVTIRATASDDRGNAVDQTVTRAFGLK